MRTLGFVRPAAISGISFREASLRRLGVAKVIPPHPRSLTNRLPKGMRTLGIVRPAAIRGISFHEASMRRLGIAKEIPPHPRSL
jgi:hypothetical protein